MRKILALGMLAALTYTGCSEKQHPQPTITSSKDYYEQISQFHRKPEKVTRDEFFQLILLHDLDGDGVWDIREIYGQSQGAYWAQVTQDTLDRKMKIEVVEAIEE